MTSTPMHLRGKNGTGLELTITGYETPRPDPRTHDPYTDWLRARVKVSTPRGSWEAVGSPLLTTEVTDFAFWLEAISVGGEPGEAEEFFEPLLRVEYRGHAGETIVLRIGFGLEFRPPWGKETEVDAMDHLFDFELDPSELLRAAQSLRAAAVEFPLRPKSTHESRRGA